MKIVAGVREEEISKDEVDIMAFTVAMIKMISAIAESKMPEDALSLRPGLHSCRKSDDSQMIWRSRPKRPDISVQGAERSAPLVN